MREIIKDKKNVLIAVLFVLLITSLGKIFTDDYRIVACVGRNRIYEKDINKLFDANQRERILKEVINNELIDIAFDDNDLVITDKEMAANLDQMKLFNYAVTTLEDLNTKELVERYSGQPPFFGPVNGLVLRLRPTGMPAACSPVNCVV